MLLCGNGEGATTRGDRAVRKHYFEELVIGAGAPCFDPELPVFQGESSIAHDRHGNGPALAAVADKYCLDDIVKSWKAYDGKVIVARVNNEKAMIVG